MFRRLTLRNFRSIEDAEVTLGPFGVVVGPNGSGKSNFADAFVFMRDLAMDAGTAISSRGGISSVRRFSKSKPYDVTLSLRIAETRESLDTHYFEHEITIKSGKDGAWSIKRERVTFCFVASMKRWEVERTGEKVSSNGIAFRLPATVPPTVSVALFVRQVLLAHDLRTAWLGARRYRLNPDLMRQPQLVTERGLLLENGANIATAMRDDKLRQEVLEPMKRVIPGLENIRAVEAGRHLFLEFAQGQSGAEAEFSASEISEGALRALGVMVAAKQMAKNELLIIEEPEANIHAGAAQLIFDVLKQSASRGAVLVTSHSPELLDAAQDEDILVCDYSRGVTRVGPLAEAQRKLVREGLFKLAELIRTEPLRIEGDKPATLS